MLKKQAYLFYFRKQDIITGDPQVHYYFSLREGISNILAYIRHLLFRHRIQRFINCFYRTETHNLDAIVLSDVAAYYSLDNNGNLIRVPPPTAKNVTIAVALTIANEQTKD